MDSFISIGGAWKFLTWLPKFILRRIFTKVRMSELILFDIRPRGRSVTLNLGGGANYDVWVTFINISPFAVELEKLEAELWCNGAILKTGINKRINIAPGEVMEQRLWGNIPDGHADQIANNGPEGPLVLKGNMDFNCKIVNFSKHDWGLGDIYPQVINGDVRKKQKQPGMV